MNLDRTNKVQFSYSQLQALQHSLNGHSIFWLLVCHGKFVIRHGKFIYFVFNFPLLLLFLFGCLFSRLVGFGFFFLSWLLSPVFRCYIGDYVYRLDWLLCLNVEHILYAHSSISKGLQVHWKKSSSQPYSDCSSIWDGEEWKHHTRRCIFLYVVLLL